MSNITQTRCVIAGGVLSFSFLQNCDDNDRREQLIATVKPLCLPDLPGDRSVAERRAWKKSVQQILLDAMKRSTSNA